MSTRTYELTFATPVNAEVHSQIGRLMDSHIAGLYKFSVNAVAAFLRDAQNIYVPEGTWRGYDYDMYWADYVIECTSRAMRSGYLNADRLMENIRSAQYHVFANSVRYSRDDNDADIIALVFDLLGLTYDIRELRSEDDIELDILVNELTAFASFEELLNAKGGYRPSFYVEYDPRFRELADAYDKAQAERGDPRRAYRGGKW